MGENYSDKHPIYKGLDFEKLWNQAEEKLAAVEAIVNADTFEKLCVECTFKKCFGDKCPTFDSEKLTRIEKLLGGKEGDQP